MTDRPEADPIVPQRATLIVSTTGQFHSRAYRIARSLVDRGHEVTVIARSAPGLAHDELHPAGYRIRRISASPLEGLPVVGRVAGRLAAMGRRTGNDQPIAWAASAPGSRRPTVPLGTSLPGPLRRVRAPLAPFARPLTVRALTVAASRVAPPADLYHAVAYTRIPIALALGRRDRAPVVYDAADIYMDSGELVDLHRLGRWFLRRWERSAARQADLVVTVSDAYAGVIQERFGIRYPAVIMNCSYRFTPPDPRELRSTTCWALRRTGVSCCTRATSSRTTASSSWSRRSVRCRAPCSC